MVHLSMVLGVVATALAVSTGDREIVTGSRPNHFAVAGYLPVTPPTPTSPPHQPPDLCTTFWPSAE